MPLFSKKKKNQESASCTCKSNCSTEWNHTEPKDEGIKILGSGCTKCRQLEAATKAALQQLGIDRAVGHVTDFSEIAAYGVMATPALVVDGKVVSCGRVLKAGEIVPILQKFMKK
jgi:small redox-active disulfide protein 2